MTRIASLVSPLCVFSILVLWGCSGLRGDETVSEQQLACEALTQTPNLTITVAQLIEATETTPQYCYIKGVISPAIVYHMQLPLPENWNGRLLNIGDGGKDGDLDFADERLAQGIPWPTATWDTTTGSNRAHPSDSTTGRRRSISGIGRCI